MFLLYKVQVQFENTICTIVYKQYLESSCLLYVYRYELVYVKVAHTTWKDESRIILNIPIITR